MSHLEEAGDPVSVDVAKTLRYSGLDYNDPREGRFASYVRYLLDRGRWTDLADDVKEADGGNSHSPRFGVYLRMLAVWLNLRKRKPTPSGPRTSSSRKTNSKRSRPARYRQG